MRGGAHDDVHSHRVHGPSQARKTAVFKLSASLRLAGDGNGVLHGLRLTQVVVLQRGTKRWFVQTGPKTGKLMGTGGRERSEIPLATKWTA